ncbi:uncharacterized protein EV420DRAFT_788432 [Desarmillaria tabescens]|uniref:Uncharacterized protein n=1 Tax=Armillaria tabescens TaxID=1929756 RepID=A0AA39JUK4_ARMTA|nr:uncharacterized protein EV420DRAFT_788432 [Desarmillaria tabescens]KAK0449039.1 hypothetical protein EV420DRAFT_788432 [Desarmillaria tabescens]
MFPTVTRTPLTKMDSHTTPPNMSMIERARRSDLYDGASLECVKAAADVHLDSQQSEFEKYLFHLSQAERYKADATHQDVGYAIGATVAETAIETAREAANIVERPSFYGNFNLYTMDIPFLHDIYMGHGEPDHEALYKSLMRHQATGYASACVTLRKGFWENGAAVSADVRDPRSCIPIPLHLTLVVEMDVTYSEEELDFFVDGNDHLRMNVPGVFANLELENESHCSSGQLLMNRCWAKIQPDGSVAELFEGYMEMKVHNRMYFLGGHGEDIDMIQHAFWAIRDWTEDDLNEEEGVFDLF